MNRLLLCITLVLIVTVANAQLEKGVWMIGGSGSFYSYQGDFIVNSSVQFSAKYIESDLSVSIGYFFVDKLSVGLRPCFNSFQVKGGGLNSVQSQFAIGPFARYYFLDQNKQFNILTDISYQTGLNKENLTNRTDAKGKYNIFSVSAGTELFLNSTIGIEILMGYKNQIESIDNGPDKYYSNTKGFQTSIGFQLHL